MINSHGVDARHRFTHRPISTPIARLMSTPRSAPLVFAATSTSDDSRPGRKRCRHSTMNETTKARLPTRMSLGSKAWRRRPRYARMPNGTNNNMLRTKCVGSCCRDPAEKAVNSHASPGGGTVKSNGASVTVAAHASHINISRVLKSPFNADVNTLRDFSAAGVRVIIGRLMIGLRLVEHRTDHPCLHRNQSFQRRPRRLTG